MSIHRYVAMAAAHMSVHRYVAMAAAHMSVHRYLAIAQHVAVLASDISLPLLETCIARMEPTTPSQDVPP